MMLTFEYEKAAPKALEKRFRREVVPKLEVAVTRTTGQGRVTHLRYELRNVMVTSYDLNASGNDEAGPLTVVAGNAFEEVKVTYTEFGPDGSSAGSVETRYDVETGKATAAKAAIEKESKKKK